MILITGASGRVGRRTAALLAASPAASGQRLRLMTRDLERAPKLEGAETVRGDFADPATLRTAFAGVTTALIVSGSGEPGARAALHRNAFEAAARANVHHVVYLSLQGSSPRSKFPYSRDHYVSEQYLMETGLMETGLPHTILRNAFYIDMFLELFDARRVIRGPAGRNRAAFVSREDCARAAAATLLAPPCGIHDVTGPEALSVADVARRLSALVESPLRYEEESIAAARARLAQAGASAEQADLSAGWFEAIAAGELAHVSDAIERFTGRQPLSLEAYFALFPELLLPLRN